MNKQLEKLMQEIKFEIPESFMHVSIERAKLIEDTTFELDFSAREILPFKDMQNFLTHLNKNFKYRTRFFFDIQTIYWEQDNLEDYIFWIINDFLGKNVLAKQFKYSESSVDENEYTIVVTDPYVSNRATAIKEDLERIMSKFGYKGFVLKIEFKKMDMSVIDEQKQRNMKAAAEKIKEDKAPSKPQDQYVAKRGKPKLIPIKELADSQLQRVYIEGEIFKVEEFQTKTDYLITTLSITDYEGAIYVKMFSSDPAGKAKNRAFKAGDFVTVQGNYAIDAYSNEPTITANKVTKTENKVVSRTDDSKYKRVELSARTRMSTMDGIVSASQLVNRAKAWGHEAIAILDADNLQSFPEFYHSAKKAGIKAIYGATFNTVNQDPGTVYNPVDQKLDSDTYVVFDLETTGLSPQFNEIIEFGAVKIKGNQVLDKVQFFIKPNNPIPKFITDLTSIDDDTVKDGLLPDEGIKAIAKYLGNHTLVAHNAHFDFSFVNQKLFEIGEPALKNPVVDTLPISRILHPKKRRFNLESVASRFGVEYDSTISHRADYDAEVLYRTWNKMIISLEEMGITTQEQLSKRDDSILYEKSFSKEISIIAKNQKGIKDLFKLISHSSTERFYKGNKLFLSDIKDRKDILIGSGTLRSRLFDNLLFGSKQSVIDEISFYDYIEVQPIKNYDHLIHNKGYKLEDIQNGIKFIIEEAKRQGKMVVATGDVRYLDSKDKIYHEVYINAKGLGGVTHYLFDYRAENPIYPSLHMLNTEEMMDQFEFLGDSLLVEEIVVGNTQKFADMIEETQIIHDKLFTPKMDNVDNLLTDLVYKNARAKYGEDLPKYVSDRIEKELTPIIKYGYDVIYWISHLLVKKSLDDGYIVGSRGSVGSSVVATFSEISEVNPLAPHYVCSKCQLSEFFIDSELNSGYDLSDRNCPNCDIPFDKEGQKIPFETFLGFEANKVPDIDLNFSGDYQPIVHEEVKRLFGASHSFRAGTISTVAERTAFGYVKGWLEKTGQTGASRAFVEYLAKGVAGTKRTTGQHPGGIIVIPKEYDVEDFSPINFPANDINAAWKTTHFDFHAIHDNVLKLDLLGHDDPTAIKMLERLTGIGPNDIPMYDEKVLSLFSSPEALGVSPKDINGEKTGAMGIPEFGTKFVRGMLNKAKVESFGDLIAISGLSHGTDVWSGNAEVLIKTMGLSLSEIVSCRDDIMSDLIHKGVEDLTAFNIMEKVRKGKGLTEDEVELLQKNNVEEWYIGTLQKIKYMFPKAHATAYVMMAWRIAWFKLYHPLAYYATYFTTRADFADVETFMKGSRAVNDKLSDFDGRRFARGANALTNKEQSMIPILELAGEAIARGIKFGNIDLNKSQMNEWIIDRDANMLIPPFSSLDGLGQAVAESVVKAREESPFTSIADVTKRTSLNKTHVKKMTDLGVFDGWNESNQMTLFD